MNIQCPSCLNQYSKQRLPKNLRNCQHQICENCLRAQKNCPHDGSNIDFRKYTLRGFQTNQQILNYIQNPSNYQIEQLKPNKEMKQNIKPQKIENQSEKDFQICLFHSKCADVICMDDGEQICSSCALFGQHKNHKIQQAEVFIFNLAALTDNALTLHKQISQKQDCLNEVVVAQYINDSFQEQRTKNIKQIKQFTNKLIDRIRKAQKNAIADLDKYINLKKQQLLTQITLKDLSIRTQQWYLQVQKLGQTMKSIYTMKNITDGFKYLDQQSQDSYIVKKGQYLKLQYISSENAYKNLIDSTVLTIKPHFYQQFLTAIDNFYTFGDKSPENRPVTSKYNTPIQCTSKSAQKPTHEQEDILLDCQDNMMLNTVLSFDSLQLEPVGSYGSAKDFIDSHNKFLTSQSSIINLQGGTQLASLCQPEGMYFSVTQRPALMTINDNKKKKKIQIPPKFKKIYQDLKNNTNQVIDFSGAQLGDHQVISMCQYISKASKLRNLKLLKNKLTDDCIQFLLMACQQNNLISINLAHNNLTQKTIDLIQKHSPKQLKNITLNFNKINRKIVKNKIEEMAKKNIIISL